MNTKLTLTIEKEVIEKAKKYAEEKGRSLSDIIENYLKVITGEDDSANEKITPLIKHLKGSFKAPEGFDYKRQLSGKLKDKYL
jgi:predicted CopG family antitoxin